MSGFLVFLLVHIQPVILTLLYLSKVKAIRQGQAEASHYPMILQVMNSSDTKGTVPEKMSLCFKLILFSLPDNCLKHH